MSYPEKVVLKRLSNELKDCRQYLGGEFYLDPETSHLPITIDMTMDGVRGYESEDKEIYTHKFAITITNDYGQQKPEVRWKSHIFHPNIMDPDDGGFVCMKMLNKWSYGMRLFDFIKNIEEMVANPNPDGPFGTDSCMAAAKFFSENKAKFTVTIRQG